MKLASRLLLMYDTRAQAPTRAYGTLTSAARTTSKKCTLAVASHHPPKTCWLPCMKRTIARGEARCFSKFQNSYHLTGLQTWAGTASQRTKSLDRWSLSHQASLSFITSSLGTWSSWPMRAWNHCAWTLTQTASSITSISLFDSENKVFLNRVWSVIMPNSSISEHIKKLIFIF